MDRAAGTRRHRFVIVQQRAINIAGDERRRRRRGSPGAVQSDPLSLFGGVNAAISSAPRNPGFPHLLAYGTCADNKNRYLDRRCALTLASSASS